MDIRQVEAFQAVMTYGTTARAAASKAIKVCNGGSERRIRLLSKPTGSSLDNAPGRRRSSLF
ncbi:hypothetical protein NBRC116589_25330 [Ruegeria sp. HU-ET01832]